MCLACDNLCCVSAATAQCGCNECPEDACHDTHGDESEHGDPTPEDREPPNGDEPSPMQLDRALKRLSPHSGI
jgi:hypothetical protein